MSATTRPDDSMARGHFLVELGASIEGLVQTPTEFLPAPRVIAVDGEWGSGKSWVALELQKMLVDKGGRVAFVDLFRYDHHDDPFAVIASSVLAELKPTAEIRKNFLAAAGAVLKTAAPIAVKAAANKAVEKLGLSEEDLKKVADATIDGAGELSATAVEKIFSDYAKTQEIQERFVRRFSEATSALDGPFVVILDELDRCRPSFALETLERVKHLFGAEKVVFVLFWNVRSIHESIRHTYGTGTDAERYLSKFVALDVKLAPDKQRRRGAEFDAFVRAVGKSYVHDAADYRFIDNLVDASAVLQPSLRDLQKAIRIWATTKQFFERDPIFIAYFILLKVVSHARAAALQQEDTHAARQELQLFEATGESRRSEPHEFVAYLADRENIDRVRAEFSTGTRQLPDDPRLADLLNFSDRRGPLQLARMEFELVMRHPRER